MTRAALRCDTVRQHVHAITFYHAARACRTPSGPAALGRGRSGSVATRRGLPGHPANPTKWEEVVMQPPPISPSIPARKHLIIRGFPLARYSFWVTFSENESVSAFDEVTTSGRNEKPLAVGRRGVTLVREKYLSAAGWSVQSEPVSTPRYRKLEKRRGIGRASPRGETVLSLAASKDVDASRECQIQS